ncbi:unnamed protein product [Acanthosepion pharaonis]|uniref:Uncharacterized protein n=1 Tax=Acanthosepion pharaonis TaxID=158019 RepID=A0A812C555_ACAPH|nr:unnamed protein product [Sepia pharaonis]
MYNSNNKRHRHQSYRNLSCRHSYQEHNPIIAVHDLALPNADSDSGFGSSLQNKSNTYSQKETFNQRSLMRSHSLSQLHVGQQIDQNSEILNNSFSAFQNTDPIMKELKECLAESENRRATLIQKLKEAQDTLQLQSDRLTKIELTSKGNNSMLNDLKKKESDYKKRLTELEKTKQEKSKLQKENKHLRQEMQTRIENLHAQLKTLQSQHKLCNSEGEKKLKLLEHSSKTIKILEEENYKLLRENGAGKTEIDIYKESLRLLKQRCLLLEEQNKSLNEDISKLQEEKQDLQINLEQTEKLLIEETEQAQLFQKENKYLANGWKNLTDEKNLIKEHLEQCEQSLSKEKSHVLNLSLQKDTLHHQLKETEIRNKQLKNDKDSLNQDNFQLQDKLNLLQHEITTEKLTISNLEENKRKFEEELSAVKKVCEELSGELCSVKSSYEQVLEQVADLEKTSSHFTQKCYSLEQEKKQLEQNITHIKENLEDKKKYYRSEKKNSEDTILQLKEEIKYGNQIRVQQKEKCTELEQKLQKTVDEMSTASTIQKEELAGWKNTCERLTGALNRKEKEIQSLADKCGDLEEVTLQLKVEVHDYKDQISNIHRLKEENRRLLQERQENEQMIQLLETEKEVLSINAKRDLDNSQRELSKMEQDMDSHKQIVADLQQTNELLVEKVDLCEKENEELKEAFSKETEISTDEQKGLKITYDLLYDEHIRLKKEYNNLLERHESLMSNCNNDSTIPNKAISLQSNRIKYEDLMSVALTWKWLRLESKLLLPLLMLIVL